MTVGHTAIPVTPEGMREVRERLKTHQIDFQKNVSAPNPTEAGGKVEVPVEQFYVRDPDGNYVEFYCAEGAEAEGTEAYETAYGKARDAILDEFSKTGLEQGQLKDQETERGLNLAINNIMTKIQNGEVQIPSWMLPDEEIKIKEMNLGPNLVDEEKLANLVKRRNGVYGDIVQNCSELQLRWLMIIYKNDVPKVMRVIQDWMTTKGSQTHIPPAFYERDGTLYQPPSFELPNVKQY